MRIKYGAQSVPGGTLIQNQANIVSLAMADASLFSTATASILLSTDAEGMWEYTWVPTGSAAAGWILKPPPYLWTLSYLGKIRRGNTKAGGLVGSNSLLELPELMPIYGDYVVTGAIAGDFVVSIGAGMTVNVAAGYAVVRGVGADNPSSRALNIATSNPTNPRIDTVVLELARALGNTEGRVTLKVVTGTAAASPTAPGLTQNTTTWQAPLYDVRSNANVSTPTSVTDRRGTPTTAITRTPVQAPVLRTAPGATSLTTTPTAVAALQHSITLVANVWYDIFIMADVEVSAASGSVVMGCYIEGTSNAGTSNSLAGTTIATLSNAHARSVLGTGAAITAGVLLSEFLGEGSYYSGMTSVLAVPRS